MQILNNPELPIRDCEWYKSRYEGLHEDVARLSHELELVKTENNSYQKHIGILQGQLDSAKDHIDSLWQTLDELSPNGKKRIEHEE